MIKYTAAQIAAEWWGKILNGNHADKRDAFVLDLEQRINEKLNTGHKNVWIESDYDPRDILLDSVRATIDPECRGMMFSAEGIFPQKCETQVNVKYIMPKYGYGNWLPKINIIKEIVNEDVS